MSNDISAEVEMSLDVVFLCEEKTRLTKKPCLMQLDPLRIYLKQGIALLTASRGDKFVVSIFLEECKNESDFGVGFCVKGMAKFREINFTQSVN